jgi:hypothetical protein
VGCEFVEEGFTCWNGRHQSRGKGSRRWKIGYQTKGADRSQHVQKDGVYGNVQNHIVSRVGHFSTNGFGQGPKKEKAGPGAAGSTLRSRATNRNEVQTFTIMYVYRIKKSDAGLSLRTQTGLFPCFSSSVKLWMRGVPDRTSTPHSAATISIAC